MTCTPHIPPPLKDVADLPTCAEIIRDIFLDVRRAVPVASSRTGPQYPRPPRQAV
ncbi:hypothetical protein [Streptomyces qinzhouensis]|uniref:hypothetical protein n=1 Tax=Streptomyces qinzhouensis TaxID=2599401 RepID=UPI0016470303|nr:hypothetical protein [Streptomyces qinzhouensis]